MCFKHISTPQILDEFSKENQKIFFFFATPGVPQTSERYNQIYSNKGKRREETVIKMQVYSVKTSSMGVLKITFKY